MAIVQDFEPNYYAFDGADIFRQGADDRKRIQVERTLPSGQLVPLTLAGVTALAVECRTPTLNLDGTNHPNPDSTDNCPQPTAIVIDSSQGIIEVYMPRSQTQKGLAGSKDQNVGDIERYGRIDVEATDGTNKVRLISGPWKLDEEVAR